MTGELVIGREKDVDLQVDDPEMSRHHVAVRLLSHGLEVEDLGSSNGTYVNGARIKGSVKVGGGARIKVGMTEFEVRGVVPVKGDNVAPVAGPDTTKAAPVIDPNLTSVRPVIDPNVTAARPVVDPNVTAARSVPDPNVTQARPVVDPQTTKPRAVPDPNVTAARSVPTPPAPVAQPDTTQVGDRPRVQASSRSVLDTSARAPGPAKDAGPQVGTFSPPTRRRGRQLASRSWVPTVASYGTAALAAAALIIYYAINGVPS